MDGAFFHGGKFILQILHIGFLTIACFDVPDGFQPFLDTVGHRPLIQNILCAEGVLDFFTPCRQKDRNRNDP